MRVAFVSQWYDPEEGSAAVPGAIVRALEARGHQVDVVTGFPNYPSGKLFDGYHMRPFQREQRGQTRVHRVALYPSHDRSPVRRALNFVSFALTASTVGAALVRRSEVTLVYSTPATVGLAGVVLRRVFRRPFVLYIADIWPDTVFATGMLPSRITRPVATTLHAFCNAIYRTAERIAVTSPGMKDALVSRGVPHYKLDVIYNWVDESVFRRPPHTKQDADDFEIMYAGNLGDVQGLETAIEAMALLPPASRIRLRLVGRGVAQTRLRSLSERLGVQDRVRFEPSRAPQDMPGLMATADVQLVSLRDEPLFHMTMPSKIQAIMATAQPLIVTAPGDAASLTSESGAGWAVTPGDPRALAQAIQRASEVPRDELGQMGERGRQYYEQHLSAAVGASRLESSLRRAMAERCGGE